VPIASTLNMVASIELNESDAGCNIRAVVTANEALRARVLELTRLLTATQGRSAAVERHLEQKADSLQRRNESLTQQLAETRGKLYISFVPYIYTMILI